MRIMALLAALAVLGGCATIRKGLGEYNAAAEKGLTVGTVSGTAGNPEPPEPGRAPALPGGLGGDKANASYTAPPQG